MNITTTPFINDKSGRILSIIGSIFFCIVSLTIAQFLPSGIDWHLTFRPAAQALMNGQSPYEANSVKAPFAGAPWGLVPLIPLALLPENIGRGVLFSMSLFAFAYVAVRMGAKPIALAAFLISPPVLHSLLNSNLDFIPLLGFICPPQLGIFLLAVKPQMGSVVAVLWLEQAWHKGKIKEVVRVFGPVTIAMIVSLLIFGLWPLNMFKVSAWAQTFNASLWPMSIPLGLALTITALRKQDARYALAASPLLSTYVLFHSWVGVLAAVISSTAETVAAVIGLWILVILRGVG